jgi:hypothetical protein
LYNLVELFGEGRDGHSEEQHRQTCSNLHFSFFIFLLINQFNSNLEIRHSSIKSSMSLQVIHAKHILVANVKGGVIGFEML